jgi:hypothetical protein
MPSSEVESKNSRRSADRRCTSAPESNRMGEESLARIERFARVLAPRRRGTAIAPRPVPASSRRPGSTTPDLKTEGSASAHHPLHPVAGARRDAKEGQMMRRLCELGNFVRGLSVMARFGDLSRARLSLLRVQLCGEYAECDWIARPADRWDADLPSLVGKRNASTQALRDAIRVRALLFRVLPGLHKAELRAYRFSQDEELELVVSGTVSRDVRAPASVRSLAMRAKLFGLNFWLDEGILEDLQPQECAVNS